MLSPNAKEEQLIARIEFAHNPQLHNTSSAIRPLSPAEAMRRAKAMSANSTTESPIACVGQIFIGIFFDGTGNNEEADYSSVISAPHLHKQSNVVRLFHAYPNKVTRGTAHYYAYYVPGVGTAFPTIGDSGGSLGTGTSWYGEPRIIWGLTRVFNAVSQYLAGIDLIPDGDAAKIANVIGGVGSTALHRNWVFGTTWVKRLQQMIEKRGKNVPAPEQITISVFGFSRGAAEARAFVNWLFPLCEESDSGYYFATVPIRVNFLGIFDTVASVGIAGGFSNGIMGFEGRQSWANKNMEVHSAVESCLHIVAAHEVRATFPLDSVRVDGRYPANVKEYVYPGAHSDVGGGYRINAQGKTDELARIPCYEMYRAALAAGVPFFSGLQLKHNVRRALTPSSEALAAFRSYMEKSGVGAGPVEDMMAAHMAHYFTYRYQARREPYCHPQATPYYSRNFYQKSDKEKSYLRDTQQHFIAILAEALTKIFYAMRTQELSDKALPQPYQNYSVSSKLDPTSRYHMTAAARIHAISDILDNGSYDRAVQELERKIKVWRDWLKHHGSAILHDEDAPERDVMRVMEAITESPQPLEFISFFDHWVHDSMAGLAKDGVNEFLLNGIGLCKFRRVYFGNNGDRIVREAAAARNFDARASAALSSYRTNR